MKQVSIEKYFVPDNVDELRITEGTALNGDKFKFIDSDLCLLFNQERLDKLGKDTVMDYLASITPNNDGLSELKKNCTDDELLSLVKSRHIQSRSELLLWSQWLNYNKGELDSALAEVKAAQAEKAAEVNKSETNEVAE